MRLARWTAGLVILATCAVAQDAPTPAPDESPNLKPPPDIPAVAVEALRKGEELLAAYQKDPADRGRLERAVEWFRKAERLAEKPFALAAYRLGIAYQYTEDFKEAKRRLERCLELNPRFHEAMLELADTYAWLKSYDTAAKMYDRAVAMKSDWAAPHRNKALTLMRKGDFKGAQAELDQALAIDAKDASAAALKKLVDRDIEGPKFKKEFRKETAHFAVTTDVDEKYAEWIGRHVELIYAKYESIFPKQSRGRDKYRVIVFARRDDYLAYGSPPAAAGYYQDLTKKLVLYKQATDGDTLITLYHEAFHQFLAQYLDHAPQWFNEGHGDYFGPSLYSEKTRQMEIRTNPWRLRTIQQAIQAGQHQPVQRLMVMTQGEMYEPRTMHVNYAMAWSLVYFFWHYENGRYARLLQEYFRFLMKDEDLKGAYEAVFAKANLAVIEQEWKQYTLSLKPP